MRRVGLILLAVFVLLALIVVAIRPGPAPRVKLLKAADWNSSWAHGPRALTVFALVSALSQMRGQNEEGWSQAGLL